MFSNLLFYLYYRLQNHNKYIDLDLICILYLLKNLQSIIIFIHIFQLFQKAHHFHFIFNLKFRLRFHGLFFIVN